MVFSSITFIFYFLPIVLLVYYLFSFSRTVQNIWLFVASLFFYAWGEPVYVLLLLGSIIVNYIFGIIVQQTRDKKRSIAKWGVFFSCVINVGVLFLFKYMGFVCDTINQVFDKEIFESPQMVLPIGISFFTFQAMSYVIDIYRRDSDAQKNPLSLGLYISFFPQLVAGPIVRYKTIADQIKRRKSSIDLFSKGVIRFTIGLGKKVLLANHLAILVDNIFNLTATGSDYYQVPVLMAWLGGICYTLQIYMDFSGYSDMAIGLGQMFGFCFEENFNYPYITKSISEFWRRWHISLSTWFREYVYIPLGGSRNKNSDKTIQNLFIVWLLTGIWHGAYWTFIMWGIYNFVFLVIERVIRLEKIEGKNAIKHIYSLFVIVFGWIIFRADNLYVLGEYLGNLFGLNGNGFYSNVTGMMVKEYALVIVFAILFSMPVAPWLRTKVDALSGKGKVVTTKVAYVVALTVVFSFSIICLVKGGYNPFIYFNF